MRKKENPGFVSQRLKEAREGRSLTAASFSELLGISPQRYSSYERGKTTPTDEVIEQMSTVLGMPKGYFFRTINLERTEILPFFRSMSAVTKTSRLRAKTRLNWLREIKEYVERFVELPQLQWPDFQIDSNFRLLRMQDIEDIADRLRNEWELGFGPISNLTWLLENKGFIVARTPLNEEKLDGLSDWFEERPFILVSSDKASAVRSRFDTAHELGHLILHRHVDRKSLNKKEDFKLLEEQAHRFAAAFLFPYRAFVKELSWPDLGTMKNLKQRWGVSIQMMLFRAKNLTLISSEKSSSLWRSLSRKGWRRNEPLDDVLQPERPRLLRQGLELMVEHHVQNREDVLHTLQLRPSDIEELASLRPSYLAEKAELCVLKPTIKRTKKSTGIGTVVPFRAN